jgi:PAS domain S-box-containing protein
MYKRDHDEKKLMFIIAFSISVPYHLLFSIGDFSIIQKSLTTLIIYNWISLFALIAIFFAVNDPIFKRIWKNYNSFKTFLLGLIISFLFIFYLSNSSGPIFGNILRQIFAIEIIIVSSILLIWKKSIIQIFFLISMIGFTIGGIASSNQLNIVSILGFIIGYTFISFIFYFPQQENKDEGVSSYFTLKQKLNSMEKNYQKLAEEQQLLLDNSPVAIYFKNSEGRYIRVNKSYVDLIGKPGMTPEDFIGKSTKEFFPENADIIMLEDKKIFTSGQPVIDIVEQINTNFGKIWQKTDKIPIKDDSGTTIGILGISTNITNEKKYEEKLNEKIDFLSRNEVATLNIMEDLHETITELKDTKKEIETKNIQLQKLDRIKSDILNITSHELRTPMSAIIGYIQMLLKGSLGKLTDEQRGAIEIILRNSNRLDGLIQDILDVSRLESGTMKFIPEKTDISKMIKETSQTMQSSADLKEIKINTEIGKDIPELTIDQDRIKQVIINMANNAIKFSPDGSSINIRSRREKDDVLFEVQDYGRGIPKDKQKRIFETFYQVDSGTDTKFGGAGLGLAISRGIVIAHGGDIWVESKGKPGEGSTFKFTLPLKSVEDIESRFKGVDVFGLNIDETKND